MNVTSHSLEDTFQLGREFALSLKKGDTIALFGDLGAGKTTFVKSIASALKIAPESVNSPTFVYLNIYEGLLPLYHFDLYRMRSENDFISMGFDEYLESGGIALLEWSERIPSHLPESAKKIHIEILGETKRRFTDV